MSSSIIIVGLGLAAAGLAGRYALRASKLVSESVRQRIQSLPTVESLGNSKYYRGGFEQKMSRREAALVLGVSPSVSKSKLKEAHKRIMLLNHPDRGGSPYIAAKINEAKDLMESGKQ